MVNKDSNGNGIPDWEERLYGLDPTKAKTADGTPNAVVIERSAAEIAGTKASPNGTGLNDTTNIGTGTTKTDQFSKELFATIAAASQNGPMDQASIDALSASLADKIQNAPPRKVFSILDLKITSDDSAQAFTNYNNTLNDIFAKNKVNYTVVDVLQKFIVDENTVDANALLKLDPIIAQINKIIPAMIKISAPQSISTLHLDFLNATERILENLTDIRLYDTDPIMSMGAISQYKKNSELLDSAIQSLMDAVAKKLNN